NAARAQHPHRPGTKLSHSACGSNQTSRPASLRASFSISTPGSSASIISDSRARLSVLVAMCGPLRRGCGHARYAKTSLARGLARNLFDLLEIPVRFGREEFRQGDPRRVQVRGLEAGGGHKPKPKLGPGLLDHLDLRDPGRQPRHAVQGYSGDHAAVREPEYIAAAP